MKRYSLRILLSLFFGVIMTVAMAWGCAIWSKRPNDWHTTTSVNNVPDFNIPDNWPKLRRRQLGEEVGITIEAYATPMIASVPSTHVGIGKCSTGLPFRSMKRIMISSQNVQDQPNIFNGGIAVPSWLYPARPWRRLPLIPLFPGFIYNTLIYGLAFLICWDFSLEFCSHRRKCRGHCPKCNYDLLGKLDNGCSECGWNRTETKKHKNDKMENCGVEQ